MEEVHSGDKKIVLASLNVYFWFCGDTNLVNYYVGVYLFNNMSFDFSCGFNYYSLCIEDGAYGSSMSENVEFMRKAVYDYSDELWEELNNGPIASSEMNLNNSSVVMNGNGLIDLSSPSILKFNNV